MNELETSIEGLIARVRELEATVERVKHFLDGVHGLNENVVRRGVLKALDGIDTDFSTEVRLMLQGGPS